MRTWKEKPKGHGFAEFVAKTMEDGDNESLDEERLLKWAELCLGQDREIFDANVVLILPALKVPGGSLTLIKGLFSKMYYRTKCSNLLLVSTLRILPCLFPS